MTKPLEPKAIRTLGVNGIVRAASVDDYLIPDGAVTEAQNFYFDRIGAATVRPGLTALGSTVLTARPAVGLHNAQSGTLIAAFSNGSSAAIYMFSAGAWAVSLDGGTASVAIRFVDFGSYTIVANFMYNTLSSMRFWNAGSSRHWHASGNPINPQNMWGYNPQLLEVYKSKIYAAGDPKYPSRLFFSSVISSTGRITWDPTTDYVDINPGDGEDTTSIKRYSLELLFFKPNYIYRFKTTGVDPDPLIKVGTRSHESVVEGSKGLYFHHDTGFYQYTGGYPECISRPIQDFIDAIPFTKRSKICAWNDSDHIYWSLGNLTINEPKQSVLWHNVVARYTESSQVWAVYSYASEPLRAVTYNSGTTLTRVVADDNGVVATQNTGTTDLGEPIRYRLISKWYEWNWVLNGQEQNTVGAQKIITELIALCETAQNMQLAYQADDNTEWQTVGELKKFVNHFYPLSIKFRRIRFKVSGVASNEAPIFRGLEIIDGLNQGIVHD